MKKNQFQLLTQRRFAPLFCVQFLGALNDNIYRYILITLVVYQAASLGIQQSSVNILPNLFAALFIFPFLIFSAFAGELADKYEKSRLIRYIKGWEIIVASIACLGLYLDSLWLLCLSLFFFGVQSTLFGPVKYSMLPAQLDKTELTGGNGLFQMGTFVAILIGTITGGLLITITPDSRHWAVASIMTIAVVGFLFSLAVPKVPRDDAGLSLTWNIAKSTWRIALLAVRDKKIFWAILLNSWFWFFGILFLTQITSYTHNYLGGTAQVNALLLALFAIGIALGSVLCERLSHQHIEIGLVPIASIAVTLAVLCWCWVSPAAAPAHLLSIAAFLQQPRSWGVMGSMLALAMAAGLYTVPLLAYIQYHAPTQYRSRIIAVANIYNSLFMVIASLFSMLMFYLGLSVLQLFLLTGVLNLLICFAIFWFVPEYFVQAKRRLLRVVGKG